VPADPVRADSTDARAVWVEVSAIGPLLEQGSSGEQHDGGASPQHHGTLVRLELKSPDDSDTRPQQLVEALMRQAGRYAVCCVPSAECYLVVTLQLPRVPHHQGQGCMHARP
jgi:hypothetical protein